MRNRPDPHRLPLLAACVVALLLGLPASGGSKIENADLQQRTVRDDRLADVVREVGSGANRATWVAWTVSRTPGEARTVCGDSNAPCRCTLDREQHTYFHRDWPQVALSDRTWVLVKLGRGGKPERVRAIDCDCTLDFGGNTVHQLDGVSDRASLRWLESLVGDGKKRLRDDALSAIALHDDDLAGLLLAGWLEQGNDRDLRETAAFWLGSARGTFGYEALTAALDREESASFRQELVFPLHLCVDPRATQRLIDLARQDPVRDVRKQALFWLGQRAGTEAAEALHDAIEHDPDLDVRKQAVFALSQLPDGEGVPKLIEIASTRRHPELIKQAMFWLGQTGDPRALDFFEKVLSD